MRYAFARRVSVRLDVDVSGRTVRVLAEGQMDPGPHDVRWTGADASRRHVASSVHLVRLRVDSRAIGVERLVRAQLEGHSERVYHPGE